MRAQLFYNPRLLCERLAELSRAARRRGSLRSTPAAWLNDDHIGSLELLRLLSPQSVQVTYDIGANVGTWTLLLKSIHPNAEVHAFEPLAAHIDGFTRHTASLADVHLHPIALGETESDGVMRVTSFSDASSLLPLANTGADRWHIHEVGEERVRIETLDGWRARTQAPWPSLIKLDVQGFELSVLRGGRDCLAQAHAVLLEVSFEEFYVGQCLFADVIAYLTGCGFHLRALGHDTAVGRELTQADALLIAANREPPH